MRARQSRSIAVFVGVALVASITAVLPVANPSPAAAADEADALREAYRTEVLADSPLSWWSLEEKTGTIAADATGPNQGFIQGGVSLGVPGPFGGDHSAMRFDGARCTGVDVGRNANSMALQQFSIEQWVRTTSTAGGILFRWRNHGYGFYGDGGAVALDGYPNGGNVGTSGGPGIADGQWHHVVGSWTGSAFQVFRDGVKVGETSASGTLRYSGEHRVAIARDAGACDGRVRSFQGDIGQVAFYPKHLGAQRVLAHYCAGGGTHPSCTQPVVAKAGADQAVDEGATVVLDASGSTDSHGKTVAGGGNLRHSWQTLTSTGAPAQLSSTTSSTPSFQALDDGTYTFRLTVSDGDLSATDDVSVTVRNRAALISSAAVAPTDDGLVALTTAFTDAGVIDTHKATIDWGDGAPPDVNPVPADGTGWGSLTAAHVYRAVGPHTVRVTISDDDLGEAKASADVTITKAGPPPPPAVTAVWADAATGSGLAVTGSGTEVTGLTHSNSAMSVKGGKATFTGSTEYATTLTSSQGTSFSPPPTKVPVGASTLKIALDDYRPGGRAAVAAAADFHDETARCAAGVWKPQTTLSRGLYWIPCAAVVDGGHPIDGTVTLAAQGPIHVAGNEHRLTAGFIDGVALVSGATGANAIRLDGARSLFAGHVAALAGEATIAGNGIEVACTLFGTSVRVSGHSTLLDTTRCPVTATGLADAVPIASPPVMVPSLAVTPSSDRTTLTPGETASFSLQVSNTGATLVIPGLLTVVNGTSSARTVAGATAAIEVFDEPTQLWVPVATTATPVTASLIGVPSGAPGVTYGNSTGRIAGTRLEPGSAAAWGLSLIAGLSVDQVERLLDPSRSSGLRAKVHADLGPASAGLYQTVRFDPELHEQATSAGSSLTSVSGELTMPNGQRSTIPLGDLAPGATASGPPHAALAPVPAPKAVAEPDDEYLARLADLDGSLLVAGATARATSGIGPVLAVQQRAAVVEQVPIVDIATTGPSTVDSGTTATWAITLTNRGPVPASSVELTATLDALGPLAVNGAPATLAPGQQVTATASHAVAAGTSTTLAMTASARWSSPSTTYGPVSDHTTTAARPPVALQVAKTWSSGVTDPVGHFSYQIDIRNSGAAAFTNLTLTDPLDPSIVIQPGSISATSNVTLTSGGGPGDRVLSGTIGTLDPGAFAHIEVRVDATRPAPGASEVINQAVVTSDQLDPVRSDDPLKGGATDPTVTRLADVGVTGGGGPGGTSGSGPLIGAVTPAEGSVVTKPTQFGTTLDPREGTTVTGWSATIRPSGSDAATEERTLATGSALAVSGTVDPTLLANGSWLLRISATDSGGQTSVAESSLIVDGQLKLGRYRTTYKDLDVPVSGIPIQVLRTYDSLDRLHQGDFGQGWSLQVASFRVQVNRPLGQGGWTRYGCGSGLIFVPICYKTERPHYVTITWPDGRTESFDFTPQGLNTFYKIAAIPAYTARPSSPQTTSRLEPAPGDQSAGAPDPMDGNIYAGGFGEGPIYNPTRFVLVAKDGTRYLLDTKTGLVEATDRFGNKVTVTRDGITSSAGPSVSFLRDPSGRIFEMRSPDGTKVQYGYDAGGDLTKVTNGNNHLTEFGYEAGHYLKHVDDPGPGLFRSFHYTPEGRLDSVTDANNHTTRIEDDLSDPSAPRERVFSPDGREQTETVFNHRGMPVSEDRIFADAANGDHHVTKWTYTPDDRDLVTSRTDPNNNTWSATWDPAGRSNLLTFTDPEGQTTDRSTVFADHNAFGQPAKVTDPGGTTTTYTWDPTTGALREVEVLGRRKRFDYSASGNLTDAYDELDRHRHWDYRPEGWVERFTNELNKSTTYDYDGGGRLKLVKDPLLHETKYEYDGVGNLRFERRPEGITTEWVYNSREQLDTLVDPDLHRTVYGYDEVGNQTTVRTPPTPAAPAGAVTTTTYTARNQVETVTTPPTAAAPLGATTSYAYDGGGRLDTVTDPLSRVTRYGYDRGGRRTHVTEPGRGRTRTDLDGSGRPRYVTNALGEQTETVYDPNGRVTDTYDAMRRRTHRVIDPWGQVSDVVDHAGTTNHTDYFPTGQVAKETRGITATVPNGHEWTSFTYFDDGNLKTVTDGTGRVTRHVYDDAGRLTDTFDNADKRTQYAYDTADRRTSVIEPSGVAVAYGYDRRSNQTSVKDLLGNTQATKYDGAGRLESERNARTFLTSYAYDPAGQLTRITDARNGHVDFGYNAAGEQISVTDADNKARKTETVYKEQTTEITTDPLIRQQVTVLDAAGRPTSHTDARGLTTTTGYWPDGQVRTELRQQPAASATVVRYGYDPVGRLQAVSDPTGTTRYGTDAVGRVTSVLQGDGTPSSASVGYGYDTAGRRTRMTIPSLGSAPGGDVTYTYDAVGRLEYLSNPGHADQRTRLTYRPDGKLDTITRPNAVVTGHHYDIAGRLDGITHGAAAGELARFSYTLDANGNRRALRRSVNGGPETSETYTLDELDRLTGVSYGDGTSTTSTYHPSGKRDNVTSTGGARPGDGTYRYDDASQLTALEGPAGTIGFGHDANGNLTSTTAGDTYSYDDGNRLVGATVAGQSHTATYDALGIRVGVDGTIQVADRIGGPETLVTNGTGAYTHGPQGPLTASTASGTSYPLTDALDSVRGVSDANGALSGQAVYDAWGNTRSSSGASTPFGYTGEQSSATGIYLRARTYQPTLGRFSQVDTVQPNAPGTQGFDAYSYTNNNPTTHTDPSGHAVLAGYGATLEVPRTAIPTMTLVGVAVAATLFAVALHLAVACMATADSCLPWPTWPGRADPAPVRPLPALGTSALIAGATVALTAAVAATVVRACAAMASTPGFGGANPCRPDRKLFITGGDVREASQHDLEAIGRGKPFTLTRGPSQSRTWLRKEPACAGTVAGSLDCDEYPFSATLEGGQARRPSLKVINARDNQLQGSLLWNRFYRPGACNVQGTFNVVPIPVPNVPTFGWCR